MCVCLYLCGVSVCLYDVCAVCVCVVCIYVLCVHVWCVCAWCVYAWYLHMCVWYVCACVLCVCGVHVCCAVCVFGVCMCCGFVCACVWHMYVVCVCSWEHQAVFSGLYYLVTEIREGKEFETNGSIITCVLCVFRVIYTAVKFHPWFAHVHPGDLIFLVFLSKVTGAGNRLGYN